MSVFDDFMIDEAVKKDSELSRLRSSNAELRQALGALLRDTKDAEPWMDDGDLTSGTIRECLRRSIATAENLLAKGKP